MHDDKILIPIEDYAALIQSQTQLNIVKRYLEDCNSEYVGASFLYSALDMDTKKSVKTCIKE